MYVYMYAFSVSVILFLSTGALLHVDIGAGRHRLGGSALAQCYKQLGDVTPDLDQPEVLSSAFTVTQKLIKGIVP